MKIERFEYFVEVARTGSITAAARRCYISQTALCQQMDALEQELGAKLLNRTKTGTTLTDAGEKLLPRAQTLLQEYQEIRRIFSREQTKENKLVIAYTGPLEQQMLLRSIPEFHRLCAQTDIQLRQRPMSAMGRELESGECDLAMALPGEVEAKGFRHVTVMEKPVFVAVSEHSPLAAREALSIEELHNCNMIVLRNDVCVHASEETQKGLLADGWPLERILYADTIENQLLMVNLDQGITLVPAGRYPDGICLVPITGERLPVHRLEAVFRAPSPLCSVMIRLLKQAAALL